MSVTISPEYVRGMTLSIQYEAAQQKKKPINETVRQAAQNTISPAYRPCIVTHNYYGSTGGLFGGGNTTVINNIVNPSTPAPKSQKQEATQKREDDARKFAVIGSILSIVGAAFAGYSYSLVTAQRASLHKIQEVKDVLSKGSETTVSNKVLPNFTKLVNTQLEIDTLNTQKITHYFLAAVGMLAGGLALASGGFMMVPALMTSGKVILLLSAIGAALNWGLHLNDDSKLSKSYAVILGDKNQKIESLADLILKQLHEEEQKKKEELNPSSGWVFVNHHPAVSPPAYVSLVQADV